MARRTHSLPCVLVAGLAIATLLSCAAGAALMYTGPVEPPSFTASLGSMAISTGRTVDAGCSEPWISCDLASNAARSRSFYTIWVVIRTGPSAHQYRHHSLHLPLRQ
jgi:hypothetical protein